MDLSLLLQFTYWLIIGVSALIVFLIGGKTERIGLAIIVLGSFFSMLMTSPKNIRFHDIEVGIAIIDMAVLAGFLSLTFHSKRFWPIWATSFQCTDMITHLAIVLLPTAMPQGYALLQGMWAYPMLISIMLGSYGQWKMKRSGPKTTLTS